MNISYWLPGAMVALLASITERHQEVAVSSTAGVILMGIGISTEQFWLVANLIDIQCLVRKAEVHSLTSLVLRRLQVSPLFLRNS